MGYDNKQACSALLYQLLQVPLLLSVSLSELGGKLTGSLLREAGNEAQVWEREKNESELLQFSTRITSLAVNQMQECGFAQV